MIATCRRLAVLAVAAALACGCEDRQVVHPPQLTLARMMTQRRADPYARSGAFADGKVMQRPPEGTVPHDDDDEARAPAITRELLALGQARFDRVCATCHGVVGDGQSVVATKMTLRPPPSLHEPRLRAVAPERLHAIVVHGYGLMPGYAGVLAPREAWAVADYVKVLQFSRGARAAALPEHERAELAREAP